jgi:pyruvate/2-oxoglutarate dehydrogenase complex dihydrolipoamide dehydrogenase (E3) component
MRERRKYDAVIVGAGQAGAPLATSLASAGWRTALVERIHVGGTCINEGCTPSKTLVASARVAYLSRRARDYGIATGSVTVDMPAVWKRKQLLVDSWRDGSQRRLQRTKNLDLLLGEAFFLEPHTLEVRLPAGESLAVEAGKIFINTGNRPAVPPLAGLDSVPYLDSTSIMDIDFVPPHLLVLGGGYVGVEFGQMFRRFGSEITLVQRRNALLPREDTDVSETLTAILREDGVRVLLGTEALSVKREIDGSLELQLQTAAGMTSLRGSHLLLAAGRIPNTEALRLEAAGLKTDSAGYIPVNDRLETRLEGIYALGDVNGGPAFTHVSYDDFRVVRTNLLGEGGATTRDRLPCYAVFTDPELGRVGLTEREARERGLDFRIFTLPMRHVPRAIETGETRGLMKAVVDNKDDRILGCAILGIQGAEVMSMLQMAMMSGLSAAQLRDAVFAHPALAEALNILFDQ